MMAIKVRDRGLWIVELVFLALYFIMSMSSAVEAHDFVGIRSEGMGRTGVAVSDPANSGLNPAATYLETTSSLRFSGRYADEWQAICGVLYEPDSGLGAGSLTWYREAADQHRWEQVAYNWATRVSDRVLWGASLKWENHNYLEDERLSGKSVSLDLGALLFWQDKVTVGFSAENFCRLYATGKLDTGWGLGVAFHPATDCMFALDLVELGDLEVRLGSEHRIASNIAVRFGLTKGLGDLEAESWTAGVGYQDNQFRIDYAIRTDEQSITHGIEFGVNLS